MKSKTIALAITCVAVACCAYTHRRVIKAAVTGEEMPKAPSWHFWVKQENRRD